MVPELEPGLCSTEAVNSKLLAFCLGWTTKNAGWVDYRGLRGSVG